MKVFYTLILTVLSTASAAPDDMATRSDGESLGISIMGTIVDQENAGQNNVALVKEEKSKRVHAVKQGFRILEKFHVVQVQPKFIVISDGTKNHLVYQKKFATEFINQSHSPNVASDLLYQEDGFERREGTIQMTAMYRDKMVSEQLSDILMQAAAIPDMENGRIRGFRLLQIDEGSIYDKAGLKNNDVITHINGQPLNNASGAIRLLQSLRQASTIQIELLRAEQKQSLEIKVN